MATSFPGTFTKSLGTRLEPSRTDRFASRVVPTRRHLVALVAAKFSTRGIRPIHTG